MRSSGQPLCRRCLEKILVRQVRRALGGLGVLGPGRDLVVVRPLVPEVWESAALRILFASMRGSSGLKILVSRRGSPQPLKQAPGLLTLEIGEDLVDRILSECASRSGGRALTCLYRAESLLASEVALRRGIEISMILRPGDVCSSLASLGIAIFDMALVAEAAPSRIVKGVRVVNPLYRSSSWDLAAAAFLASAPAPESVKILGKDLSVRIFEKVHEIYSRSHEMIYSALDKVENLLASAGPGRCRICSSPAVEETCWACRILGPLLQQIPDPPG